MRDDSSVERFLGNDNDKIGFHFGVSPVVPIKFSGKIFKNFLEKKSFFRSPKLKRLFEGYTYDYYNF